MFAGRKYVDAEHINKIFSANVFHLFSGTFNLKINISLHAFVALP